MLFEFTLVDPDHVVFIKADDQESAEQQAQSIIQSLSKNGVSPEILDIREVAVPPNFGEPEIASPLAVEQEQNKDQTGDDAPSSVE